MLILVYFTSTDFPPVIRFVAFCLIVAVGFLVYSLFVTDSDERLALYFGAGIFVFMGVIMTIPLTLVAKTRDPEARVESELRAGFFNNSNMLPHQVHTGV